MKISNSKKELAKIISENGGWRGDYNFAAQDCSGSIQLFELKPTIKRVAVVFGHRKLLCNHKPIKNWHQAILSRAEYLHLYPAPDADGWIEWGGGFIPVRYAELVDVKYANGTVERGFSAGCYDWNWSGDGLRIIAYRLHKPGQAKPEFCESVTRSIPGPESKPTIESLAADYRNLKDYADRKQEEADAANAEAEAKLVELVAAGNALNLVISFEEKAPELVITHWRDLQVGDEIEVVKSKSSAREGMVGVVSRFDKTDDLQPVRVIFGGNEYCYDWPTEWRFIRRPAK